MAISLAIRATTLTLFKMNSVYCGVCTAEGPMFHSAMHCSGLIVTTGE